MLGGESDGAGSSEQTAFETRTGLNRLIERDVHAGRGIGSGIGIWPWLRGKRTESFAFWWWSIRITTDREQSWGEGIERGCGTGVDCVDLEKVF